MKKLLIATTSRGKLKEFKLLLKDLNLKLVCLNDFAKLGKFRVKENGQTFEQNAVIKAKAYGNLLNLPTLADDSGLCIKALNGGPGLYTARYSSGTDKKRWQKLLEQMSGVKEADRAAYFISSVALFDPKLKRAWTKTGRCYGKIALSPKGKRGFGYDPIFKVRGAEKHFAQLSVAEKNHFSHRAKAIFKIKPLIKYLFTHEI